MDIYGKIGAVRHWINKKTDIFPRVTTDMILPCKELHYNSKEVDIVQVSSFAMLRTPSGYFRFARRFRSNDEFNRESEKLFDDLTEGRTSQKDDAYYRTKERFIYCSAKGYNANCIYTKSNLSSDEGDVLIANELQHILAEEFFARLFDCSDLLTKSEWCKVIINDKVEIYGLMSTIAEGVNYNDSVCRPYYNNMIEHITPEVQRQLLNLNLIDLICNEVDHGPNNYMLKWENNQIKSICAFDNSHPHAFLPIYNLKFRPYHYQIPVVKGGCINRPFLDNDFVERLRDIDLDIVKSNLQGLITKKQIKACLWRINKLKETVDKSLKNRKCALLKKDEWTSDTMYEEYQSYGHTYLWCLANWWQLHHNMQPYRE